MGREAIVAAIILVFTGCLSGVPGIAGQTYWDLEIAGHTEVQGDEYVFIGEVGLSGNYGSVEVKGVRIHLVDSNNETMRMVSIGVLNSSRPRSEFSVGVHRPPERVLLTVGSVSSPDNMEYEVSSGLQRTEGGRYAPIDGGRTEG